MIKLALSFFSFELSLNKLSRFCMRLFVRTLEKLCKQQCQQFKIGRNLNSIHYYFKDLSVFDGSWKDNGVLVLNTGQI